MAIEERETYERHVLWHYEEPYHRGHGSGATHAHREDNPVCGDWVQVELCISAEGVIQEGWFQGQGCCLSQAAASMLVQHVEGLTTAELQAFRAADMLTLCGVRLTPLRQRCSLLAWKAAQQALFAPLAPRPEEPP